MLSAATTKRGLFQNFVNAMEVLIADDYYFYLVDAIRI